MRVEINELVSHTKVHGEIVLANIETGMYFSFGKPRWNSFFTLPTWFSFLFALSDFSKTCMR